MNETVLIDAKGEIVATEVDGETPYPPIDLIHTVELMTSEDYKDRFKAEYHQAKIRYDKLDAMTVKYEAGTLPFKPSCPLDLLLKQKTFMGNYIRTLKIRAEIEGIEL